VINELPEFRHPACMDMTGEMKMDFADVFHS